MVSRLLTRFGRFTLLRSATGTLALRIGAAGLGFLNGVLLARWLGPAEFGVYSIALAVVHLGGTVSVLGLPMLVTREAAASAEDGQWGRLRWLLRSAHSWVLVTTLLLFLFAVLMFAGGFVHIEVSWMVVLVVFSLVSLTAFNQLRAAFLRGWHWVVLADLPDMLLRPATMLMLLVSGYYLAMRATAGGALVFQLVAVGVAFASGSWWLIRRRPVSLRAAPLERSVHDRTLTDSFPFLVIALVTLFETQISLYLLGFLSDARQAGLFQAAFQLVGLIVIGLMAVNMPLQPRLAAAWARGDIEYAQRLLSETARLGLGIALVGLMGILFFPEALLRLYGSDYMEAAHALQILAIGQVVNAASGSCGVLLLMTGHQRIVMAGIISAAALNALIAYVLIPSYGVLGAAYATTASLVCWNFIFVAYSAKKLKLNSTVFRCPSTSFGTGR